MKSTNIKFPTKNVTQTILIFIGMGLLLSIIGFIFAGGVGAFFAFFLVIFSFLFTPRVSPNFMIKLYNADMLDYQHATGLYEALKVLSVKAGLKHMPTLYYLPSTVINSFTLGDAENSKIVLSDGLLSQLNSRELYGVLAHEVSHIQNNDLSVMMLADVMSRITSIMSLMGLIMLFLYLPLYSLQEIQIPWLGILLLSFAPNFAALLQMGLSRTREYNADQQAAYLTGDALGLAFALEKIHKEETYWASRLLIPHYRLSEPSLLRTHPSSQKRIERLLELAKAMKEVKLEEKNWEVKRSQPLKKKPRHRIHGMWY